MKTAGNTVTETVPSAENLDVPMGCRERDSRTASGSARGACQCGIVRRDVRLGPRRVASARAAGLNTSMSAAAADAAGMRNWRYLRIRR